jgi:hypothetical protein
MLSANQRCSEVCISSKTNRTDTWMRTGPYAGYAAGSALAGVIESTLATHYQARRWMHRNTLTVVGLHDRKLAGITLVPDRR